jgi:hypothetical protein
MEEKERKGKSLVKCVGYIYIYIYIYILDYKLTIANLDQLVASKEN